jgi:acetyl esterase/lipase
MSEYMNPHYDPSGPLDEGDDIFIVNSADRNEMDKLRTAGLTSYDPAATSFPMAGSLLSRSGSAKKRYVAGNDIAAAPEASVPDRHVNVYDVESYSWDVYCRALDKYGSGNVALMGTSSGGGICVGICVKAAREGKPQPANTLLLCPWVDTAVDSAASLNITNTGGVDVDTMRYWGSLYTGDHQAVYRNGTPVNNFNPENRGPGNSYYFASPMRAAKTDPGIRAALGSLRNITIYAGSNDPCYPDSKTLYDGIQSNGGNSFKLYNGRHAFMFYNGATPNYGNSAEVVHDACWKVMCQ